MKQFFKKIISSLTILTLLAVIGSSALMPATASAQTDPGAQAVCQGVGITGGNCGQEAPGTGVNGIVKTVINILSWVVGIVAVIMIIIGGLKYVTSSGDSANVNSAKNTILFAIVGLIIVALAQVLVRFVITKVKT